MADNASIIRHCNDHRGNSGGQSPRANLPKRISNAGARSGCGDAGAGQPFVQIVSPFYIIDNVGLSARQAVTSRGR